MAFENLIGNERTKNLLSYMVEQGKITHSYLFIGVSGVRQNTICKRICKNDTMYRRKKAMLQVQILFTI